jgi:hypothetical protein
MPNYTLPGDVVDDLVQLYCGVVPPDIASSDRPDNQDDIYALCEMIAIAECVDHNWRRQTIVSYADGLYLQIQAQSVGLNAQAGESTSSLQARIRGVWAANAITPDLIQAAIQQIVTNAGFTGTVYIVELPLSGMRYGRSQCWGCGWRWSGQFGTVIALIPLAAASVVGHAQDTLRAIVSAGKTAITQVYQ